MKARQLYQGNVYCAQTHLTGHGMVAHVLCCQAWQPYLCSVPLYISPILPIPWVGRQLGQVSDCGSPGLKRQADRSTEFFKALMEPVSQDLHGWDTGNVLGTSPAVLQLLRLSGLGVRGNLAMSLLSAREEAPGMLREEMLLGGCEQYSEAPPAPNLPSSNASRSSSASKSLPSCCPLRRILCICN